MTDMKKVWHIPELRYLTARDTHIGKLEVLCKNSICISKCEVCGGCTGSNTKIQQCSYYIKLDIKKCANTKNDGCKLPIS